MQFRIGDSIIVAVSVYVPYSHHFIMLIIMLTCYCYDISFLDYAIYPVTALACYIILLHNSNL